MKHLTYGDKSLFVDDDAAALLIAYTVDLAESGDTDTVDVNAISSDGNVVTVSFILNAQSQLVAESATGEILGVDNESAIDYVTHQLRARNSHPIPIRGDSDS